jgi:hypothetical protein
MPRALAHMMFSIFLAIILILAYGRWASAADPLVTLSTSRLTFGAQAQGTSGANQLVQVTNNGQGELTIASISITGEDSADFTQTNNCPTSPATITSNGHCEIHVIFHPTSDNGTANAALSIDDNASGSPQTVILTGTVTAATPVARLTPATLPFGNQAVNTASAVRAIVLTNVGSTTLHINSAISLSGASSSEFRLHHMTNGCPLDQGELAPRASCTIGVIFAPTSNGAKSAQVTVVDDAAGSPHVAGLSGTGIAPAPAAQ